MADASCGNETRRPNSGRVVPSRHEELKARPRGVVPELRVTEPAGSGEVRAEVPGVLGKFEGFLEAAPARARSHALRRCCVPPRLAPRFPPGIPCSVRCERSGMRG